MSLDSAAPLEKLLSRWEELTSEESQAIQSAAWFALAGVQSRKRQLQTLIAHQASSLSDSNRQWLRRLVEMEEHNLGLLGDRLHHVRGQLSGLERTRSNLRRIHQSYGPRKCPSGGFGGTA